MENIKVNIAKEDYQINIEVPTEAICYLGEVFNHIKENLFENHSEEKDINVVAREVQKQILDIIPISNNEIKLAHDPNLDPSESTKLLRYECNSCGAYSLKKLKVFDDKCTKASCTKCGSDVSIRAVRNMVNCRYECKCGATGYFLSNDDSKDSINVKCVSCKSDIDLYVDGYGDYKSYNLLL